MKNRINLNKEKIFYLVCFCFCALMLFYKLYNVMFAVHDDMRIYTLVKNGRLIDDAIGSAKCTGRISHIWNHLLLGLPFAADKVWFYKLFQYGTILFNIGGLHLLLSKHFSKRLAALSSVLSIAFLSISHWHSLVIAYALCHQLPIGLLLLSLHFYLNYMEKRRKRDMVYCCLLYLPACMIYEAFTLALIIYGFTAMYLNKGKYKKWFDYFKRCFFDVLFPFLTALLYVIVYFSWKKAHPVASVYDGTDFYITEPFLSIRASIKYSTGVFPFTIFENIIRSTPIGIKGFITTVGVFGFIKGIIVALATAMLIKKNNLNKNSLLLLIISASGTIVPTILIGFTAKYLKWNNERNINGYVPSFYSYFFLIALICVIGICIYNLMKDKRMKQIFIICAAFLTFAASITADFNNGIMKPHYERQFLKCKVFDMTVSDELSKLTEATDFYIPDNIGINTSEVYTEDYIKIYVKTPVNVIMDKQIPDFENPTVCLRYNESYEAGIYGVIDSDYRTDSLKVITPLLNSLQAIVVATSDGGTVRFENVKNGDVLNAPEGLYFDMSKNPMR